MMTIWFQIIIGRNKNNETMAENNSVKFRSKKRKNFRRREPSASDEEENAADEIREKLVEAKEARKFREKQKGVSSATLALGKKFSKEEELDNDPFKLSTGGLISLKDIKDRNRDRTDEGLNRDVANMGSTFAAETNQRDEEAEMMKYIDERMAEDESKNEEDNPDEKYKSPEDKLYELPDNLKSESKNSKSEEMLSNQMLSGIPEVDLGTEAKIKNIERTEEAKQQHMRENMEKKKNTTSFVPTNMAVNYVQHARYMHESLNQPKRKPVVEEAPKPRPVVVGDAENPNRPGTEANFSSKRKSHGEKATDDYHYERFRKQNRRY